jgi:oxygen-independent coproporphyrinogen-3 oxidase
MTLAERLQQSAFQGYAYAYPHKMAYRPFEPALPLQPLWERENRDALFLYLHVPFCKVRCGFCNLFTTTHPGQSMVDAYLQAIERQMEALGEVLGGHRFARGAVGGGTPTFLSEHEIEFLFSSMRSHLGHLPPGMPLSFEMSPETVTAEKMALLVDLGVTRASMGVQSFLPEETRFLGRPQDPRQVASALELMRAAGFRILNLDLIYGAGNQTTASWLYSLQEAMKHSLEEIYLYPLYVRPLTGLDKLHREPTDQREELYRVGRDFLLSQGYEQVSMRFFRRKKVSTEAGAGPVYCCQEDGMVGLGPGARSYTAEVHYSSEYAVGRNGIQEIIRDFSERTPAQFSAADYGCVLDEQERRRRYLIKSLLRSSGVVRGDYRSAFVSDVLEDFPELRSLFDFGLAEADEDLLLLTPLGLERSDTIGPWLFSTEMQSRIEEYELT